MGLQLYHELKILQSHKWCPENLLSVAVIEHSDQRFLGKGRGIFALHTLSTVQHQEKLRSSGQELKEAVEEHQIKACFHGPVHFLIQSCA